MRSSKKLFVILDSESGPEDDCIVLRKDSRLHDDLQMYALRFLTAGLDGRIKRAYGTLASEIREVVLPKGAERNFKKKSVGDILEIIKVFFAFNSVSFMCFLTEVFWKRLYKV